MASGGFSLHRVKNGAVGDLAAADIQTVGKVWVTVQRSHPCSASASICGSVALFSTSDEVSGTDPGMLATQ